MCLWPCCRKVDVRKFDSAGNLLWSVLIYSTKTNQPEPLAITYLLGKLYVLVYDASITTWTIYQLDDSDGSVLNTVVVTSSAASGVGDLGAWDFAGTKYVVVATDSDVTTYEFPAMTTLWNSSDLRNPISPIGSLFDGRSTADPTKAISVDRSSGAPALDGTPWGAGNDPTTLFTISGNHAIGSASTLELYAVVSGHNPSILWSKSIANPATRVFLSGSGTGPEFYNLYAGYDNGTTGGLIKYDISGTLKWNATPGPGCVDMAVTGSSFFVNSLWNDTAISSNIRQYDHTAGTMNWFKSHKAPVKKIAVDSSENLYVAGYLASP